MPYLISAGKVTQNNQPTPMYIMARLNLNGQCISVANEYADLKIGVDAAPFKAALEKKKASGKAVKARDDLPRRHARSGSATGSPPAASIPTRTSRPSWCRRRRWWPT